MYQYNARVTEVYDGDTITAIIDLGFHIKFEIKCRLYGINAPEVKGTAKDLGIVSRDRLRELVLGKDIIIKTIKDKQEKFGRWLGTLYLIDSEKSINELLIEEGLALEYIL